MSHLTIEVWDATGNKKQTVEVPSDAAINRVIAVLVEKMNLPRHSPDGQLMSYKFHHRASGRQLLDAETLSTAGVREGDILRLQPEITAGALNSSGTTFSNQGCHGLGVLAMAVSSQSSHGLTADGKTVAPEMGLEIQTADGTAFDCACAATSAASAFQ